MSVETVSNRTDGRWVALGGVVSVSCRRARCLGSVGPATRRQL